MIMLKNELLKLPLNEGLNTTGINNFFIGKLSTGYGRQSYVVAPSIVLIVQGPKNIYLGDEKITYENESLLICTANMPIESELPYTTPENPLLSIKISIDLAVMAELLTDYDEFSSWRSKPREESFIARIEYAKSMEAIMLRILEALKSPADQKILGKSLIRELYYEILKSPSGHILRNCTVQHSKANTIAPTLKFLEKNFKADISIEDLASHAGMSPSALHKNFKKATSLAPMQFLKKLRLHHALNLMQTGANVSAAAFESGYNNAAQFSREFKREFNVSPRNMMQSLEVHISS